MRGPIIKEVLGITNPKRLKQSHEQAMGALSGRALDWEYDRRVLRAGNDPRLTQQERERVEDLVALRDLLEPDKRRGLGGRNMLNDWHTYAHLVRTFGTKADGNATALLVGAQSAISTRAFLCLARDEYGANKALTVDLVSGMDKARHGKLVRGDALNLPLSDGSMDFVSTNQLMHMLQDPSGPEGSIMQRQERVLREIGRVAAPGGQVIMKERVPAITEHVLENADMRTLEEHTVGFGSFVADILEQSGFENPLVRTALITKRGDERSAYLFDRSRDITPDPTVGNITTLEIYARKS